MNTELKIGTKFNASENDAEVNRFYHSKGLYNDWAVSDPSREDFKFVDGPPFVSSGGLHYGHCLVSNIKDYVLQLARQMGYNVENIQGFDTHGLPIELVVNQILDLKTRKDILEYGVARYNQKCRDTINSFRHSWRPVFESIGRLTSSDHYITMSPNFMENCWRVFYEIDKRGLVYRGFRVMPYSPACSTPLSNFEASLNYKETTTTSIFVQFPLICGENSYFYHLKFPYPTGYTDTIYIVAWTTTPWTLPANMALCVNGNEEYVVLYSKKHNRMFLVAETMITKTFKDYSNDNTNYSVIDKVYGSSLVNEEYEPLYIYAETTHHTFKILDDTFVSCKPDDNGTGVVHLAPAFGEDDMRVCQARGITNIYVNVDDDGKLMCNLIDFPNSYDFNGVYFQDASKQVIKDLTSKGLILNTLQITHSYPHCWRTDTPLIYRAQDCWFIEVTKLKDQLIANNKTVNWFPSNVGTGRFHEWLNNTKDWCISRNRVFGTPIPIWVSQQDSSKYIVVKSVEHLCELSGKSIPEIWPDGNVDLHSEFIDPVTFTIDGHTYKRVETVFDCWLESGCVPMAMSGTFDISNPPPVADFICEGIDQTRGWFYTLMVLSTALFDRAPFKNVMCSGLILAKDGKKMSKRLNNFTDPMENLTKYGGDTIRLYMLGMPATSAESTKFKDEEIIQKTKSSQQWINSVKFLFEHIQMYESATSNKFTVRSVDTLSNEFDLWIVSLLHTTLQQVKDNFLKFNSITHVNLVYNFIEAYTNWYLKFNRFRLKGKEGEQAWIDSLSTCVYITNLFNQMCCPVMPFISETIYQNLTNNNINFNTEYSVRLTRFPNNITYTDPVAERKFSRFVEACETIRSLRQPAGLGSTRQPVKAVTIYSTNPEVVSDLESMIGYFTTEEVNVINVEIKLDSDSHYEILANPKCGSYFRKDLGAFKKYLATLTSSQISSLSSEPFTLTLSADYIITPDHYIITKRSSIITNDNELLQTTPILTVVLDKTQDEVVYEKHFLRMCVFHTQHIRKGAGIRPWNKLYFKYNTDQALEKYILDNQEYLERTLCYKVGFTDTTSPKWCNDTFTYESPNGTNYNVELTIYNLD
jgi:isoleucyl-tRNA synthetase